MAARELWHAHRYPPRAQRPEPEEVQLPTKSDPVVVVRCVQSFAAGLLTRTSATFSPAWQPIVNAMLPGAGAV